MSDVLERICADKREEVARRKKRTPLSHLVESAGRARPARRFREALARASAIGYGLIAEIKRASPSKGIIRTDFDPARLARAYARGGATCLSVLTDTPYFEGADDHLIAARAAVELPVLRKDFMLEPYQIVESRALGADCVLLIMAALDDAMARDMENAAYSQGMDVLIEVHNEAELERALALRSPLIGINNRDLKTLKTDTATTLRLAPLVPDDRMVVAESGLYTRADLDAMAAAGARCFLIGESLMRQDDVETAVRTLLGDAAPDMVTAAAGGAK
jgi:indole-3-glycerol phosphate synthase